MTPQAQAPDYWLKPPVVVKVGGSLFDWPELKIRLPQYLATEKGRTVVVVPGGGADADAVRKLDQCHRLGEEASHWLALRALTLNAHFLAELLPDVRVVEGLNASRSAWRRGGITIIDMFRFARGDESRPDHPPHNWSVTSDSLAARVAQVAEAERLVLLKSVDFPREISWSEAARLGHVDPYFPTITADAPFTVEAMNLRSFQPKA
jgi:aspartokinase-like uncharacterized kinase